MKLIKFLIIGFIAIWLFLGTATGFAQTEDVSKFHVMYTMGGSFYADNYAPGSPDLDRGTWSLSIGTKVTDRILTCVAWDKAEGPLDNLEQFSNEWLLFAKKLEKRQGYYGDFNPFIAVGMGGTNETKPELTQNAGVGLWWTPPIDEFQNLSVVARVTLQNYDNGRKLITIGAGIRLGFNKLMLIN